MRNVGIHIRISNSIIDLAQKAFDLQVPFFQCFFLETMQARIIEPNREEIKEFLVKYRPHFTNLFLHGSYWINLAGTKNTGHAALHRELKLAQRLEFTHLILHPGSAAQSKNKQEGIDALARSLNKLIAQAGEIKIVLENVAHGGFSIGGNFDDFSLLLPKIDKPEKLFFCVDTAHAYSYGYDLTNDQSQAQFIQTLQHTITIEKIILIHLNDTQEKLGSKIDRHAMLGDGLIGNDALKKLVTMTALEHIPLLLELPVVAIDQERRIINEVKMWK